MSFLGNLFSTKKETNYDDFVLTFIAHSNHTATAVTDAPSNVLTIFKEDFCMFYGPFLATFMDSLVPEGDVYIKAKPCEEKKDE